MAGIEQGLSRSFDRSTEFNWYNVSVGTVAEFVVRAFSEDAALHKTTLWCQENSDFGIHPDNMLPVVGMQAELLSPEAHRHHRTLDNAMGGKRGSVRFTAIYHTPDPTPQLPPRPISPKQGKIFEMDRRGEIRYCADTAA